MGVRRRPDKDGGGWIIDIGVKGWPRVRRTIAKDFTKRQAEAVEREWRLQLEKGQWPFAEKKKRDRPQLETWGQLAARWWERKGAHLKSGPRLTGILDALSDSVGDERRLSQITTATFDEIVAAWTVERRVLRFRNGKTKLGPPVGPHAINGRLRIARAIWNRAKSVWSGDCPPLSEIAWRELEQTVPDIDPLDRHIAPALRQLIIDDLRKRAPHAAHVVELAEETGLRAGSVFALRWEHVSLERGIYRVQAKSMDGRWLVKPITSRLMSIFHQIGPKESGPVVCYKGNSVKSIKTALGTSCRRLGIKGFNLKHLRNTLAIEVLSSGGDLADAQEALNHSTPGITHKHYGRLDLSRVTEALERRNGTIAARFSKEIAK